MARQKKETHPENSRSPFSSLSPLTQDALCIVLLYVVTLVLFRGIIFDDAAFATENDTVAALSFAHAGNRIAETEGTDVLWMPYFFSGMPTFGNVAYVPHNVSYVQTIVQATLNLLYLNGHWTWFVVYYLLGGVFMFFLMRVWRFSRAAALIAAFTFMVSPYAIGLAGEGHGSKLMALTYLPLTVLLTHLLFERRDLLSFGLFAAGVGTLMLTNHMQIVYYVFMFIGLYLVYHVAPDLRPHPGRAALKTSLFIGALLIGFAMSSYIYLSVYEYAQYSMRGGGTTGAPGGLTLEYATMWSWHPGELITLLVPGFYGMKADLYWGPMIPWTNSSVYVGLVPLLLTVIALAYRRTKILVFLACATLLLLLMSLGRNFPLLYGLLFEYLPFFNKFRAPVMVLHLLPFTAGAMAAAGFTALVESKEKHPGLNRDKLGRILLVAGAVLGGLLLLGLIFKSGLFDTLSGSMFLKDGEAERFRQQYGNKAAQALSQIKRIRFDVFWRDYVKFSLIAMALCGLVVAWLRGRIREWTFAACTVGIVIIDLFLVSSKYIDPKPNAQLEQNLRPDATIAFLQRQPGLFRVFPLGQLFMDYSFAYHGLQSIGGYSPAKLKIYQTMLDSCLYRGTDPAFPINMNIVNMLNTEFLVVPGALPGEKFPTVHTDEARRTLIYRNPGALPRAFFVDTVITASDDGATFRALNDPSFDPGHAAVLYTVLPQRIVPVGTTHTPVITSYTSRKITLAAETPGPALLVLSEIYYPAGWKAFVDGNETEIYRTNYVLRSIVVPSGKHEVVFSFDPPVYRTGWILSNASWGIAGLCVALGFWRLWADRARLKKGSAGEPVAAQS